MVDALDQKPANHDDHRGRALIRLEIKSLPFRSLLRDDTDIDFITGVNVALACRSETILWQRR